MSSAKAKSTQRPLSVRLAVSYHGPDGETKTGATGEIDPRGLFVLTDTPVEERRLVHVQVALGDGQGEVELHGVVSRSLVPARASFLGQPAGMEVQLCGGDPRSRSRWTALIAKLRAEQEEQARQQPAGRSGSQRGATLRRSSPRPAPRRGSPAPRRSPTPGSAKRSERPTPSVH